jgi:ABC-type branched-subunit amino acid transport system substrate-binding protein
MNFLGNPNSRIRNIIIIFIFIIWEICGVIFTVENRKIKLIKMVENKLTSLIILGFFLISLFSMNSSSVLSSTASVDHTNARTEIVDIQDSMETTTLPSELVFCGVFPVASRPPTADRRDGFYIAVDEINSQTGSDRILPNGVNIKAIALDDNNNDAGGITAANSCIGQGAHIVIGTSSSNVSMAMQNVLKNEPIIQISYASSHPPLSNRTAYPYFMRVIGSDADEGLALVDLVDSFGFTKGAMIHTDDSYGTEASTIFSDNWSGNLITTQVFTPGAGDVSTEVQALNDSVYNDGVQFVLLHADDLNTATVIKEAFNAGLTNNQNVTFILTGGGTTPSTFVGDSDVKNGMQNVLGVEYINKWIGPKYQSFLDTWNTVSTCSNSTGDSQITCGFSRTGSVPNSITPLAYDAVYVAAKGFAEALALNASFSATPSEADELLDVLYGVTHEGAGGTIEFNLLGEMNAIYDFVTLVNDIFHPIGKWNGSLSFTNDSVILPSGSNWLLFEDFAVEANYFNDPVLLTPTSSTTILEGEVSLSWNTVNDFPGVEITYSSYYSLNSGATWQLIASNLDSTSYLWDTSSLSDNQEILIKVEAKHGDKILSKYISANSFVISNPESTSSTPPSSSSKPTSQTTGGLELLTMVFSLMGIYIVRKRKKKL